jgi:phosphoribosyl-ATP pyrophosphohydrolase
MDINELDLKIRALHKAGAYHRKRGFRLNEAEPVLASNHVIEEAVELQAECVYGTYHSQLDEAADLLCVWLHLLWLSGVPLSVVLERASQKLDQNFTLNPDEVETKTPGRLRSNRSV